ncbi:MAG: hypothetical protein MZW92_57350 [Comamonadaceae bacterium]|nr:hypothetical protein [Comamonadaceae bacterium]
MSACAAAVALLASGPVLAWPSIGELGKAIETTKAIVNGTLTTATPPAGAGFPMMPAMRQESPGALGQRGRRLRLRGRRAPLRRRHRARRRDAGPLPHGGLACRTARPRPCSDRPEPPGRCGHRAASAEGPAAVALGAARPDRLQRRDGRAVVGLPDGAQRRPGDEPAHRLRRGARRPRQGTRLPGAPDEFTRRVGGAASRPTAAA